MTAAAKRRFTTETAPKGYIGPVQLTAAQRATAARMTDAWVQTLIKQANDDSDPETRDNARLLLTNRGIAAWKV